MLPQEDRREIGFFQPKLFPLFFFFRAQWRLESHTRLIPPPAIQRSSKFNAGHGFIKRVEPFFFASESPGSDRGGYS